MFRDVIVSNNQFLHSKRSMTSTVIQCNNQTLRGSIFSRLCTRIINACRVAQTLARPRATRVSERVVMAEQMIEATEKLKGLKM
jgi:hypothetical protein